MSQSNSIPIHLALILDGNGRWAKKKGLIRSVGHKEGAQRLIENIQYAFSKGIQVVSIFAFSTENWKRPKDEVDYLFSLPKLFFDEHISYFIENKIKIVISGEYQKLPKDTVLVLKDALEKTKNFDKKIFNIALNYGGKDEILMACQKIAFDYKNHHLQLSEITKDRFEDYLYHKLPPIDLLIRTSNEQRLSNFMLWQLAYAELVFVKTLWPAFTSKKLEKALQIYAKRNRRFGGLNT